MAICGKGSVAAITCPAPGARVEPAAVVDVETFDWKCPQHVTQQFTLDEVETASRPLHERIAALKAEVRALRRAASGLER
jgi:uncharacterized protein